MKDWRPKPKAALDLATLKLTGEEGFVLSRLDGATSVETLVHLTGMPEGRVNQILRTLVDQGAVERGPGAAVDAGAARAAPAPSARRSSPSTEPPDSAMATQLHRMSPSDMDYLAEATVEEADIPSDIVEQWRHEVRAKELADGLAAAHGDMTVDGAQPLGTDVEGSGPRARAQADDDQDVSDEDLSDVDASAEGDEDLHADPSEDEEQEEEAPSDPEEERNYRKLYETVFHPLPNDQRVEHARKETGSKLLALCFDPDPAVVRAVFENTAAGLPHARLVAAHHRNPVGLDVVVQRAEWARDAQVVRFLLRNTQLSEAQLRRVLQNKRMAVVYKVTIDRDVAERNRQKARNVLRAKWSSAQAEERADLIFSTEGRVLLQLTGLPFDSHTTSLLCARPIVSLVLVQNLARFAASPPAVLAHLLKQPTVKRQQHLKNLILQHPNCPADAKRRSG